jgi:hypothetical protein
MIKDTIKKIKSIDGLPEVNECYWLEHDIHGYHDEDYCYKCAEIAYNILINKEYFRLQKHHPRWYDCTKYQNKYYYDYEEILINIEPDWWCEGDSIKICAHCGCLLEVSLTNEGVDSELSHYEHNGFSNTRNELLNDCQHFLDILEQVKVFKESYYQELKHEDYKVMESLYHRAVKLCEQLNKMLEEVT